MWSGYPNYSSKNRKGGNLKRKGKIKINENKKWKGNENNLESPAFSLDKYIIKMLYNSIILESYTFFCITCDHVTVCDITLTPNPKFKIRNKNEERDENQ